MCARGDESEGDGWTPNVRSPRVSWGILIYPQPPPAFLGLAITLSLTLYGGNSANPKQRLGVKAEKLGSKQQRRGMRTRDAEKGWEEDKRNRCICWAHLRATRDSTVSPGHLRPLCSGGNTRAEPVASGAEPRQPHGTSSALSSPAGHKLLPPLVDARSDEGVKLSHRLHGWERVGPDVPMSIF